MNRKKWQGMTCVLLASLMMSSVFASSTRSAEPKPVVLPKQIETQQPTSQKQNTSNKYPTQGQSITPIQSVTPNKEESPKPLAPQTQQAAPVQTAAPKQTATPMQTAAPKQTQAPKEQAKPSQNVGTTTKQAPKCVTPKKEEVPKQQAPKAQTPAKKPFTLDHFKMIVCTLKQLGMQENEIVDYIKQGKKLEDILKAEKISPKKFKKCIIKQYNKAIDEGVKEGQITKEQCKQLKVAIKETVKNWLPQSK